jgi:hypothetical protein
MTNNAEQTPRLQIVVENETFGNFLIDVMLKMLRESGVIAVEIAILAKEGENFTHPDGGDALVPQGHTYVAIEHSFLRQLGSLYSEPEPTAAQA